MSSSPSTNRPPLASIPRFSRQNLRQATLVLPRTGERVRRSITLRNTPNLSRESIEEGRWDDRTPLLQRSLSERSQEGTFRSVISNGKDGFKRLYKFTCSRTGQGILKCSLAYLLASMATFVAPIAGFLGKQDGKHMVATVTVYFHPARSQGNMHEAALLASIAFLYSAFVSFFSMTTSALFGKWDLIPLGHAIVLIVFVGGGLGFVGWIKQRLGNPLVNVACSLTSIGIITVLTKEEAVQLGAFSSTKIVQILKMIIMGIVVSIVICLVINPISARKELRETMIKLTDSFSDMLSMITRGFLNGSEEELRNSTFTAASSKYKAVFTSLTKNLNEAMYEHYVMGKEKEYHVEAKLVGSMQRLAQNIGGLRSAAETQFSLLSRRTVSGATSPTDPFAMLARTPNTFSSLFDSGILSPRERPLGAINEVPEEGSGTEGNKSFGREQANEQDLPTITTSVEIFERFIVHLGPSMKSLAYTLKETLDELPFGPSPEYRVASNTQFRASLVDAIELYSTARTEALKLLYENHELNKARPMEVVADIEEVAASCGHFSYCLLNFAEEMKVFIDILDELRSVDETKGQRSWNWLKFWRRSKNQNGSTKDPEHQRIISDRSGDTLLTQGLQFPQQRRGTHASLSERSVKHHTVAFWLWELFRWLRRDDKKFAIKVGVGAALFALPSFIPETRPTYAHWRGEWGLLSYMLVCSMTIGATNTTSYARVFGTCIGAICAVLAWVVSHGNPYALATLGWLMSLVCFYVIVAQGKGPMGRFFLLTYNLSCLYAYSLSVKDDDDDDDEGGVNPKLFEIALHRVVAVTFGTLWGLFITRIIWPISARQKLQDGISILWLRMGLIWKRDPLSTLLEGESPNAYMNISEELELQQFLTRLEGLLAAASSEFDFKGPFPNDIYTRILKSTSNMLDAFHAMNVIISKDPQASQGEIRILRYTAKERAQLCARISHLFQVLASSMKLEYPLNDALPSTEHARDRLLTKIFKYRSEHCTTSDTDFALLYAYALVTGQLSAEIAKLGSEVESLFGVLDEDLLKLQ